MKYLIIASFIIVSCAPKKSEKSPKAWVEWTQKLKDRYKEKYSSPTITHHVYLGKPGDTAALDFSGSYPRFRNDPCDSCTTAVTWRSGKSVWVNIKGMEKTSVNEVEVPAGETAPLTNSAQHLITPQYYESENKFRIFIHDLSQPELERKRKRKFFKYAKGWKIKTQYKALAQPEKVTIQRSDGSQKEMQKVAILSGELKGKKVNLSVYNYGDDESYKSEKKTMLLFRDQSNGKKTYGAGRFLNVEFPKAMGEVQDGEEVEIDFNFSYNPPCAVSTGFHCPLPQDIASVAVEAGEKYTK